MNNKDCGHVTQLTVDANHFIKYLKNNAYFAKIFSMDSRRKAEDALKFSVNSLVYQRL